MVFAERIYNLTHLIDSNLSRTKILISPNWWWENSQQKKRVKLTWFTAIFARKLFVLLLVEGAQGGQGRVEWILRGRRLNDNLWLRTKTVHMTCPPTQRLDNSGDSAPIHTGAASAVVEADFAGSRAASLARLGHVVQLLHTACCCRWLSQVQSYNPSPSLAGGLCLCGRKITCHASTVHTVCIYANVYTCSTIQSYCSLILVYSQRVVRTHRHTCTAAELYAEFTDV